MKESKVLFRMAFVLLAIALIICFAGLKVANTIYKGIIQHDQENYNKLYEEKMQLEAAYASLNREYTNDKASLTSYRNMYNAVDKKLAMYKFVYGNVRVIDVELKMEELGLREDDMWEYDLEYLFYEVKPTVNYSVKPSPSKPITPTPTPTPKVYKSSEEGLYPECPTPIKTPVPID